MASLSELIRQKEQQTEEWKQRKADERDSLNDMNDAAALRVTESTGAFLHYLDVQADNPRFSASNVLLAMEQNPEVTVFNSVKGWNGLNRNVMREEVGMKIRVGDTYVRDGRQYRGYKVGRVFDISQTTGRGQPAKRQLVDGSDAMSKALYQLLMVSPVPVVTGDARGQDALYDPNQQQIAARSSMRVFMIMGTSPITVVSPVRWARIASAICSAAAMAFPATDLSP